MSGVQRRLAGDTQTSAAIETLAQSLSGADVRSALLTVAQTRAANTTPADVMRQYATDRFARPGSLDPIALARVSLNALEAAVGFEPVTLAPLVPLGTHQVGQTPQNNVVTTMRLSEVAADPTNGLTLVAAERRKQRQPDPGTVRLSAVQRVVRAQRFEGPVSFAHFSLLGLVSAGRTQGRRIFAVDEAVGHALALIAAIETARPDVESLRVLVSDFGQDDRDNRSAEVVERLVSEASPDHVVDTAPDRTHGRGYYVGLCFKVFVTLDGEELEVGDGGEVPWTQALLADAKERQMISGIGLDRLAIGAT